MQAHSCSHKQHGEKVPGLEKALVGLRVTVDSLLSQARREEKEGDRGCDCERQDYQGLSVPEALQCECVKVSLGRLCVKGYNQEKTRQGQETCLSLAGLAYMGG